MTGDEIRLQREKLGLSQEALAREIGTTQQTIQRIEKNITQNSLYKDLVIDFLKGNYDNKASWSLRLEERIAQSKIKKTHNSTDDLPIGGHTSSAKSLESIKHLIVETMPVYPTKLNDEGLLDIGVKPIDIIARPASLHRIADAYGLYIADVSMVPSVKSGEIILLHPHLPPLIGEEHFFTNVYFGEEQAEGVLRKLIDFSPFSFEVEQYNPTKITSLGRTMYWHCHRVVGKYMRL